MSTVIANPAPASMDPPNRRLVAGLLASVLLHVLVLSLQFGIPGLRPGPGGPLTVHLAPLPAHPDPQPVPATVPETTPAIPPVPPAAALPAIPVAPAQTQAREPAVPAPRQQQGFTLLDPPRPKPAPTPAPAPAIQPRHAPRRRARARAPAPHDGLHAKVIAQDVHKDDSFSVPPEAGEPSPDPEASARTADTPAAPAEPENAQARQLDPPPAEPEPQAVAAPDEKAQQAERERLAGQREQELAARREAEEQALQAQADLDARRAAEQQARQLAQQDASYQNELASRQRQADDERRRADEALARSQEEAQRQAAAREQAAQAARQQAEQQRIQAEQDAQAARQLAEQQRAQQLAEQQRIQAEQHRAQQLAEQQRIQAEQERAQQVAEQQRIRAEQERAQQVAEQQRARQQAEQLAREQAERAEQAERLARQEQARRQPDPGGVASGLARPGAPGNSGLDGVGRGAGALPRAALESPLATRARELLRGIDIDKPVPQAVRPAEDARRNERRAVADAVLRDVPLRMYIDSIRQKIERNAIVSPAQLNDDTVRIFPIVSIAVRSDGSVEDVTIVRSSGRADIDEVVRRVVRLNARYAAFPPNVAAHYDVVELRRVWSFAGALRLLEEMH